MTFAIPLLVFAGLSVTLWYARQGGLGVLSRKIQDSDRWALEDAIAEKRRELMGLEALRARYPFAKESP